MKHRKGSNSKSILLFTNLQIQWLSKSKNSSIYFDNNNKMIEEETEKQLDDNRYDEHVYIKNIFALENHL